MLFPDRFRNGDPSNDQDFSEWYYEGKKTLPASGKINPDFQEYYHLVKDWNDYKLLTQSPHTPDGRDWMAFYGGDIEGVRQRLDYLRVLGVTAIYFNPIFEGKSTHKYDGGDYMKVDPHFGTNEQFKTFVQEALVQGHPHHPRHRLQPLGEQPLGVQGRGREGQGEPLLRLVRVQALATPRGLAQRGTLVEAR
jgi:glycosidase